MKGKLGIFLTIMGCCIADYVLYAILWSLFTPRPAINIQLAKAVAASNKKKMTSINQFWRFDSTALAGNKTVQFHYTITKWVKDADSIPLKNILKKYAYAEVKNEKALQEFRDSNVIFVFQYLDFMNQYTYSIPIMPADYK